MTAQIESETDEIETSEQAFDQTPNANRNETVSGTDQPEIDAEAESMISEAGLRLEGMIPGANEELKAAVRGVAEASFRDELSPETVIPQDDAKAKALIAEIVGGTPVPEILSDSMTYDDVDKAGHKQVLETVPPTDSESLSDEENEATLEQFLERAVYPELRLTDEDRSKAYNEAAEKGVSPEKLEIINRSFDNIRETLRLYFKKLTIDGVIDEDSRDKEIAAQKQMFMGKYIQDKVTESGYEEFAGANSIADIEIRGDNLKSKRQELIDNKTPQQQYEIDMGYEEPPNEVVQLDEQIRRNQQFLDQLHKVNKDISFGEGQIGADIAQIEKPIRNKFNENPRKVSMQEAMDKLAQEISRVEENMTITYNCDVATLKKALSSGKVSGLTALGPEDLASAIDSKARQPAWSGQFMGSSVEHEPAYLSNRRQIESALGYAGDDVVYACTWTGPNEGMTGYGPITLELEPDAFDDVYYSEGDTIPKNDGAAGPIASAKAQKANRAFDGSVESVQAVQVESAKKRQLLKQHMVISKAVADIMAQTVDHVNNGAIKAGEPNGYYETHLIGGIPVDIGHIKGIVANSFGVRSADVIEAIRGSEFEPLLSFSAG